MTNSLDLAQIEQPARRDMLKKGLGLAVGTATGMGSLLMADKAHAWGPWHTTAFTSSKAKDPLKKLLPDYDSFYLRWKNSDDAMTKQARLYAGSSSLGVPPDTFIGFMQFDQTYANLGAKADRNVCTGVGDQVLCEYLTLPITEKDFYAGTIQTQENKYFSINPAAEDGYVRRLSSRGTYTSPELFRNCWEAMRACGRWSAPVVNRVGSEFLGAFYQATTFTELNTYRTLTFFEYVYGVDDGWMNFSTVDVNVVKNIGSPVASFEAATRNIVNWSTLLTSGGAALGGSVGYGWASAIERVASYSERNVTVAGNVTDTSYLRHDRKLGTKLEVIQTVVAATATALGTAGAIACVYPVLTDFSAVKLQFSRMQTLYGVVTLTDYLRQGVYGAVNQAAWSDPNPGTGL